jgi:hypothetical protein
MTYNIYYGTIGKTLGVRYRFTRNCNRGEQEALKIAKNAVTSFYYKNEGKFGLPSFDDINKESKITGIPIEKLYDEHIEDMCRWYAIPTELDTIPTNKLRW